MRTRHLAVLVLVVLAAGGCRKKRTQAGPGTPPADSAALAERERARQDSIVELERADAQRAERERREREQRIREAREAETRSAREALEAVVYFGYDSDQVEGEAEATLRRKLAVLQANPGVSLRIEGHADQRGSTEYNLALGQRRAEAVRAWFGGYGIDTGRFTTVSFGKERPAEEGTGEDAFARNRRAEFSISAGEITVVPQGMR